MINISGIVNEYFRSKQESRLASVRATEVTGQRILKFEYLQSTANPSF